MVLKCQRSNSCLVMHWPLMLPAVVYLGHIPVPPHLLVVVMSLLSMPSLVLQSSPDALTLSLCSAAVANYL